MSPRLSHAFLFLLVALSSCSDVLGPRVCTHELRSTIIVEINDARTGAPAVVGSTVIVRGASVYDSVLVSAPLFTPPVAYMASEDRVGEGRYTVEVRRPGYAPFIRTNVDVTGDECHSGPGPRIQVSLQPLP